MNKELNALIKKLPKEKQDRYTPYLTGRNIANSFSSFMQLLMSDLSISHDLLKDNDADVHPQYFNSERLTNVLTAYEQRAENRFLKLVKGIKSILPEEIPLSEQPAYVELAKSLGNLGRRLEQQSKASTELQELTIQTLDSHIKLLDSKITQGVEPLVVSIRNLTNLIPKDVVVKGGKNVKVRLIESPTTKTYTIDAKSQGAALLGGMPSTTSLGLTSGTVGGLSSTDNAIARWDGTGGNKLQDSPYNQITDRGDLYMISDNSGGENTSDSTRRFYSESYQRAESPNNFGEVYRIYAGASNSKQMIAWYDNFTTPNTPVLKAWIGWHYSPNDPSDLINPHNHISIETPDSGGLLRTRLEVVSDNLDTTDVRVTNANFVVANNNLGVQNIDGQSKQLVIYTAGGSQRLRFARWSVSGTAGLENGVSNVGTDFRIASFNDDGSFRANILGIVRSSGRVFLNGTTATGRFQIESSTDENSLVLRNTAGSNNAGVVLLETQTSASRIIQGGLQSDTTKRFSVEASGQIEWGPGGAGARDTNIYRGAANVLRTDDSFVAAGVLANFSGRVINTRVFTSGVTAGVSINDYLVVVRKGSGSSTRVILPTGITAGTEFVFKDGIGDAATNSITVTGTSLLIDGSSLTTISSNFGSNRVVFDGSQWITIT